MRCQQFGISDKLNSYIHRFFTITLYKTGIAYRAKPYRVKKMNKYRSNAVAALFALGLVFASNPSYALSHPLDFHANARLVSASDGPVDKAYGYMHVVTDTKGGGIINVMFSNGTRINRARFNARVKFLDASGSVIREEYFNHRIRAAGLDGAVEFKVTKPLARLDFDSIEVDFYMTDIPDSSRTASYQGNKVKVSLNSPQPAE